MDGVTIVKHPLVQHKLTLLRDKTRSTKEFRELFNEIGALLCYEVTRDLPLETDRDRDAACDHAIAGAVGRRSWCSRRSAVPAAASSTACSSLLPSARVAHIGLYRDPRTLVAVEYFFKAPDDMADHLALVLHPMLATGNSAVAAVDRLKEHGARNVRIVCLLVTGQAVEKVRGNHPDVHIWTAAIDDSINEQGYILPGIGDVGDRMYGTR